MEPLEPYPFAPPSFRAQCLRVVDGDTVDLFVDLGFYQYKRMRIRLAGIDTPELNSKDPDQRELAQKAKQWMVDKLRPVMIADTVILTEWPLRVVTYKDPDSFGRWLGDLYVKSGTGEESINATLLDLGLAKTYMPRAL